jgi:multiple sugar transport system permease protein
VLIAPTLALLIGLGLYPVLRVVWLSFYRWSYFRSAEPERFAGLANWERLFGDAAFLNSLKTTFVFLLLSIPAELVIGLAFALLLNRQLMGRGIIRSLLMLPMMISPVVVALIWKMMYQSPFGPLNAMLQSAGIISTDILWLSQPNTAMAAIVIATVWQWYPFSFLVYLAGLQTIPSEELEAAAIDGASPLATLRYITMPHLASFTLIILLVRLLDGFKTFALVYALTGGGPGNATNLISFHVYRTAFSSFNLGYGSTLAVALMAVILVCGGVVIAIARRSQASSS